MPAAILCAGPIDLQTAELVERGPQTSAIEALRDIGLIPRLLRSSLKLRGGSRSIAGLCRDALVKWIRLPSAAEAAFIPSHSWHS